MTETPKNHTEHLTSARLLARNTLWNLVGGGAPMLVAIVCMPILMKGLGKDRFGILALAWVIIGYAGFFDLGVGRALTQFVAKKLGAGEDHEIPALVWTSLFLMLLLGIVGAAVVVLISPWLVHRALHIPAALQRETLDSFYLLALSLPIVITTAGLRGFLEAHQRFGLINVLRIPLNVFVFVGPVLVLPFSHSLFPVVAVLVGGRVVGWVAHLVLCLRVMPALRRQIAWHRASVGPLLSFGGWMTVSNVVSPVMVYMDRVLIGMIVSVRAVAYYTAPSEITSRLSVIPGAMVGVLFPAFAYSFVQGPTHVATMLSRGVKYVFLSIFPLVLVIVALAPEGLNLWLGAAFATNAGSVLRWLAVGTFINCLAFVPFAMVQSLGRPDITAKLHLLELPLYLCALWSLVRFHGIEGAALASTGRVTLDAVLLFAFAHRLAPLRPNFLARLGVAVAAGLILFYAVTIPHGLAWRAGFLAVTLTVFGVVAWSVFLASDERAFVLRLGSRTSVRRQTVVNAR